MEGEVTVWVIPDLTSSQQEHCTRIVEAHLSKYGVSFLRKETHALVYAYEISLSERDAVEDALASELFEQSFAVSMSSALS